MSPLELFKDFLKIRNYSEYTQRDYVKTVELWIKFNKDRVLAINDGRCLGEFLEWREVGKRTLNHDLSALRTFFHFLSEHYSLEIPKEILKISPKFESKLPKFFTIEQIKLLLDMPDKLFQTGQLKEFFWRRDKALLELLYGTGIRVGELVKLCCSHVDWSGKTIRVLGKGQKERIIPIGQPALNALLALHACITTDMLVPGETGKALTTRSVELLIKKYLQAAKLPLTMTPHSCRHSYATHMLQNGANLRALQALLGDANLSTTQKYTHVDINFLQKVYNQSHPQK